MTVSKEAVHFKRAGCRLTERLSSHVATHMELLNPKQVNGDHMDRGDLRLMPAGGAVVVRMGPPWCLDIL